MAPNQPIGSGAGTGAGTRAGAETGAGAGTGAGIAPDPAAGARAAAAGWLHLPRTPLLRHLSLALAAGLVMWAITFVIGSFNDYQVAQIGLYAIALMGLSVLVGANGQISLGHGAFMAVGAYAGGEVFVHTQLPLAVGLVTAAAVAAAAGIVVGLPASRLRGPYLAGMTLALAIGLPAIAIKFSSTLGGEQGLSVNPPVPPGAIDPQRWLSWVSLLAALITMVVLGNVLSSRIGRALRAVRDDEVAASLSGISVARTQVLAFAISAACAGLAGGLLALSTGVVNPGEFPVAVSISLLAGMVLGGTGSLIGAWWGAVILVYVPQWSSSVAGALNLQSGQSSNLALLFYGLVLIVVMLAAPSGVQGALRRLWRLAVPARRLALARFAPSTPAGGTADGPVPPAHDHTPGDDTSGRAG